MPEISADKTIFTLAEVARSIQKTIAERYKSLYWIKAEMNKLNHYSHSGHCYPELLEKRDGKVVAEMRATLWKGDYQRIHTRFLEITKEPLKNGINILLQAAINYDPVHGFSLHIVDIDPAYSLGELAREKQLSINTLKTQGIFDANKQLTFPLLPKRIAIISVETSKGLADFLKIIQHNPYNYHFEYQLFPALLQGDKSVASIISQLHHIKSELHRFDVVAIIRGGGGEVGLSAYNHLDLATAIATFPLPVITGVGHATNETVSEMVAYKNAITPSELADFLIQHFHKVAKLVLHAQQLLKQKSQNLFQEQQERLGHIMKYFRAASLNIVHKKAHQTATLRSKLIQQSKYRLLNEHATFKQAEKHLFTQSKNMVLDGNHAIAQIAKQLKRENVHLNKHFNYALYLMLDKLAAQLHLLSGNRRSKLDDFQHQLTLQSKHYLSELQKRLENQERNLSLLDPLQVLKRGYSITLLNGKALTHATDIKAGDQIKTILAFGEIESDITFVYNNKTDEL